MVGALQNVKLSWIGRLIVERAAVPGRYYLVHVPLDRECPGNPGRRVSIKPRAKLGKERRP
jgi:hypothetical protein